MKTKLILFFLIITIIIVIISCGSRSGHFNEVRIRESQAREIKKQHEMKHGISVIVILHDTTFTTLNDSVAFRVVDNTYFVKRKDVHLGDWRYYRIE